MDYEYKYLKYKIKYNNLKQKGGSHIFDSLLRNSEDDIFCKQVCDDSWTGDLNGNMKITKEQYYKIDRICRPYFTKVIEENGDIKYEKTKTSNDFYINPLLNI